ncbi:MAG: SAF domain-containing protein [Pseudanabaena sp.]
MKAGDVLTIDNLRSIRPAKGLPPKYYNTLLGKTINQDAKAGTPISWDLLG